MTTPTRRPTLAALPERQLKLLAAGILTIAVALAASAIRAPLAALRLQQARMSALEASGVDRPAATTPVAPAPAAPAPAPAPTPLALIEAVSAGAMRNGVAVTSAVPGPERTIAGLRRQSLEIDANGDYAALLAWIAAIEASQPAVGLIHLEMRPAPDEPRRLVRLQLGIYSKVKAS